MRRLVKWVLVPLGIVAVVRRLRRRPAQPGPAPGVAATEDPAEELRRKLAESRAAPGEEETPPEPASSVEERRADVHAEGRTALDEMQSSDES